MSNTIEVSKCNNFVTIKGDDSFIKMAKKSYPSNTHRVWNDDKDGVLKLKIKKYDTKVLQGGLNIVNEKIELLLEDGYEIVSPLTVLKEDKHVVECSIVHVALRKKN